MEPLLEEGIGREVIGESAGEIVRMRRPKWPAARSAGHVGADESCGASNEDGHEFGPFSIWQWMIPWEQCIREMVSR